MQDKLYKIQTPKHRKRPIKQAVGIDFGTTNCVVSFTKGDKISLLKDENNNVLHPSLIDFKSKEGKSFKVKSVKRLIGKNIAEVKNSIGTNNIKVIEQDGKAKIVTKNANYSVEEISALILKRLKLLFRSSQAKGIEQAVITVPAFFSDIERHSIQTATKLAGIKVLRLINEPTSALLAYGLDSEKSGNYAVYDFGGGTFDVSVLRLVNNVFQVKSTKGDLQLGGDDIDFLIAKHFGLEDNLEFMELARELKHKLTEKEEATCVFNDEKYTLTSDGLYLLCKGLLDRTISILKDTIRDSDLADIDGIVLVGGSTKMPIVKKALEDSFSYKIYDDLNPETIVAKGAAIQADKLLNNNRDILLIDVNPISLGIETMGGVFERIIDRNSPIPIAKSQNFTTFKDNQYSLELNIYQGERELVKDCRLLGVLILDNIPLMLAGMPRIKVNFILDENSILSVKAIEETTGIEQVITLNPEITSADSLAILKDAMVHGKEDLKQKEFIHSKIELEQIIQASKNLVRSQNISKKTREDMLSYIDKAEEDSKNFKTRAEIDSKKQEIEEYFKGIVKKDMNSFLDEYLVGKSL
ncbi:MAG: Hsp70 family protein [Proteobacteria bacterium]|nr:Hsp70 family protein [Pseudomonadota bacterium]